MLNPLMLFGLLGLSVPIIIHLINRQRMRPRLLATLRFLGQQDVANAFAPVPRDLLQLLLRLALLALFILLMARVTGPSPTTGPRALGIVLDNSMSMQRLGPDGRSLFEAHRARIVTLVRGMKQGDSFSFTLVGDKVFTNTGFSSDRAALERAVTNAWVSDGGARSLFGAIENNLRELRSKKSPNTALLVFSDQQTRNYQSHLGSSSLAGLLQGSNIKPVFVQDAVETPPNVELKTAEFFPERIYMGAGSKLAAQVYNASPTQLTTIVSLMSGSVPVESRPCNLSSGETAQVELCTTMDSQNDTAWKVGLSDDGFAADNVMHASVRMLKLRQVLLVAPDRYAVSDGMTMGRSGPELFACAVNPAAALAQAGGTYISVKRVEPTALEQGRALSLYSMVVLYGIHEFGSPEIVKDLAGYVRQGGGIYLVPDSQVDAQKFNDTFAPLLSGFKLGALREPAVVSPIDKDEKGVADPLLRGLLRGEWGTIHDIVVARYFATEATGAVRAALKTADGNMLIGVADLGKGHVCVQTHSWEVDDISLPRTLAYVSVVQAIVDRLSGADTEVAEMPDHIRVGDVHHMSLPMFRGLGGDVVLTGPRTYSFPMAPEASFVTVKDLFTAGAYRATHAKKSSARDRWLAVNRDLVEGDPSFMSAAQLGALCGRNGDIVMTSDRIDGLFSARREMFPLLLALVFIALTAETIAGALSSRRKKVVDEPVV